MVLLVAYTAWLYPFEVAFLKASPPRQLYIADNIVNLFFAIDIVLTFFVAYIDARTQLLVRDRKKIAKRLAMPTLVALVLFVFLLSREQIMNTKFLYFRFYFLKNSKQNIENTNDTE